jgi:hypothetical protein
MSRGEGRDVGDGGKSALHERFVEVLPRYFHPGDFYERD